MPDAQLTARQERFIVAVLSSPSAAAAARRVGVSQMSVWRWMRRRAFVQALRAARRKVVEKAALALNHAALAAVRTLARNLRCGDAGQEIRAALGVLENVRAFASADDIEERIAALEARVAPQSNASRNGYQHTGRNQ